MTDPRVLVVALGRINAADASNNGLLLRNLFADWPRDALAQIYSGGDNGDEGFFGSYHRLGPRDRRFGRIFLRLKAEAGRASPAVSRPGSRPAEGVRAARVRGWGKRILMDTGLYELIFRPRLSGEMSAWVRSFRPDLLFAQGYNLTFARLPLMLARRFRLPIAYYPTDDWPAYLYRPEYHSSSGRSLGIERLARRSVLSASRRLVREASVRLAFNRFMRDDYRARYGKEFDVLMHGDDIHRFELARPVRSVPPSVRWIVCAGIFDEHRFPLLEDLERACAILRTKGLDVRASVFPVLLPPGMTPGTGGFRHVSFESCPGHAELASVLRGADLLFLPERFDRTARFVRTSVSSKAHLFMLSGRPIVVYSDPATGIARYAREEGWAVVVDRRDPLRLAEAFERLIRDDRESRSLVDRARLVAEKNHDLSVHRSVFADLLGFDPARSPGGPRGYPSGPEETRDPSPADG